MYYIRVDYHEKYWCVVVKGKVDNAKEKVRQLLKPYQSDKSVLEAPSNWGLVYRHDYQNG